MIQILKNSWNKILKIPGATNIGVAVVIMLAEYSIKSLLNKNKEDEIYVSKYRSIN